MRSSEVPTYLSRSLLVVAAVIVMTLGLSTAALADDTIVFADFSWESVQVHNRIAGFIVEHGYGYDVDYEFGHTVPILLGMRRGEVHVSTEIWVDNILEAYTEALEEKEIIDLGSNYPDSPQGWYIPTYVIEGDPERDIEPMAPDLRSVFDLPEHWELFQDPEDPGKGRFYNAPTGWVAHDINVSKFGAYGLDETFNAFDTGSDAALAIAIVAAYERGDPVVAYYWEPTWIMGLYDMTMLEEPEYSEDRWGEDYACAYPDCRVHLAVSAELLDIAPELVTFLANYETTLEQTNEVLAFMEQEGATTEEAALWFLENYPEVWRGWLILDEVQERVEVALGRAVGQ